MVAPASADRGEVTAVQPPVPNQIGVRDGQGKQGLELRFSERASSRHDKAVPIRVKPDCYGLGASWNKGLRVAAQGESNWDSKGHRRRSAPRSTAGYPRPTSPANGRSATSLPSERAGYEVVSTYKETASGVRADRAERRKVMALAQRREVDAVLVTEVWRWGRSTTDLLATLKELESRRVSLVALNWMAFDLSTPHGRMMATLLTGIAEFERELTVERIRSGIAAAKARGKKLGQQHGQRPKSDRLASRVLALIAQNRSYRLVGREVGLSKNTVAGIVKRSRSASGNT